MTEPTAFSKKKIIFYNIFLSLFIGVQIYISGPLGALQSLMMLIIYGCIAYGLYLSWKTLTKQEKMTPLYFMNFFFYRISLLLIFMIIFLGGSSFYKNEISPTAMPTYYLSNGEKEIVFQGMSHIGSEGFYHTIRDNLAKLKKQGFVYYFEGVREGTKESTAKFDEAMGVKFDKDLYENFSKLYGVIHQDNSIYLGLVNNEDYNIDLSFDDIIENYENSPSDKNSSNKIPAEVLDINTEIVKTLAELSKRELAVIRYINKAMLNFMIGSQSTQNFVLNNLANEKLFDVILNKRNEVLAEELQSSEHKKIFVTYGLLHFEGVYNLLIERDNTWNIDKVEYLYPITGEYFGKMYKLVTGITK